MMATGLGSFVKGAFEGYENVKEIQRKEALAAREEERFAMEKERYDRERSEAARREQREKDIEAARQEAMQAEKDADTGMGDFANYADPNAVAARQQAQQSVDQKATASYDAVEMQRYGIRPPKEAQTASVTPAETDILKKGGVGLYKNQKAADDLLVDKQMAAYRKMLVARGEIDKVVGLEELAQEMKDKGIARLQKQAAAFVMADAPPDLVASAVSKVYGFVKDGKEVDPAKSTYDAKTGTYNFAVVDQATGNVEQRAMNKQQLLTGLQQFTPAKLYEFEVGRRDREEDLTRKATERKEDLELARRGLDIKATEARGTADLRAAQKAALQDQVKGAEQKARVDTISKLFPEIDLDIAKIGTLPKAEQDALRAKAVTNADLFDKTTQLSGLNPRADVRTLANAARMIRDGTLKAYRDNRGVYTKIGDTRIELP
jgi:hypothetical protein